MSTEDFIPLGDGAQTASSSKGKGKAKENTTVFVSSLPYTATTTDLITHFSFLGPVRHGFVATDKESGKSKGVGYVTYSLKEDAEKAVDELNGSAFGDKGRKIRVSWADARPAPADRVQSEPKAKKPRREAATSSNDPDAIRTLVLTGLPADLTKAVLWKKVRKVNDQVELKFPVEGEDGAAHLVFPSHAIALKSLPKLHGHTYKGALLSCVLKKRLDKLVTTTPGEGKGPSHAGRLIIRNLAWDTTEQDLRAAFLPFGPIHSINLPTAPSKLVSNDPSKPAPPRARGFAFVWFLARKDAETAMEAMNGKVIPKAVPAGTKKGKAKAVEGEGRPVAVDWALSKDQWEKEKGKPEDNKAENDDDDEEGSDSGSSSDDDSDEDEETDEEGVDEDVTMIDGADGSVEDDEDIEEEPVKPTLPTVDVGSTLFVRNLPFETTEQELNTLFRTFGPLRYARITIDKSTGRSRGSGFVCFWNVADADAAIEEAQKVASETGANSLPLGGGSNPFALPSVLTADPSSSLASKLVIHGRTLEVSRAVTREDASRMKEDSERARQAGDKRNTYLMREGVVFPNSPAAANLPEAEVEKRQSSFNARRALLRSNPSLYISKTRLSIRQLPLFVTDRGLKRLAIHAIREFDAEVEAGSREGLSRAEEMDESLSPALAARKDKKKRGERETAVIQSKVVRQSEKLDPLTGQGRSKGYGFLEMRSHKDALKVLRWANNNADVGALIGEWWKTELQEITDRAKVALTKAREEKKGDVEELEARVRRLEARVAEKGTENGMRGGKTLMIEFSIENVQVVKRRVEKITAVREGQAPATQRDNSGKKRRAIRAEDSEDEGEPAAKKGRFADKGKGRDRNGRGDKRGGGREKGERSDSNKNDRGRRGDNVAAKGAEQNGDQAEKRGLEKLGSQLGSMIGRKRKMRKGGK